MPSIQIGSANIIQFGFKATFDLANRSVIFDTSTLTQYQSGGIGNIQGISFFLEDQDGVVLAQIDFSNPSNYIVPSVTQVFTLDLSSVNYAFLFQAYQISASIKDQDNTIYNIPVFSTTICQPNDFQESGYVYGSFQVRADCVNNDLTVKEFTVLVYNNLRPQSVTKSGTLNYPTGTISPISFSITPFSNNVVYTGQYSINNTTIATYSLPNDIYVLVNYFTWQQFDITCSNQISDLLCCISELYQTKVKNCDNAIGKRAAQQLQEIEVPFFLGLGQEINGQDSEWAYQLIKKQLKCNCGNSAIGQNEVTPTNPSVYNIVLQGVGGTTAGSSTITGNTKTFPISSNIYQVVKGDTGDNSYTITVDSASTPNTIKYIITFNYANMAAAIYTATAGSPTLIAQLNSLISATANIDLSNLNGKCVIDLSSSNYFLSYIVPGGSTVVTNIVIGSTTYSAPGGLLVSNISGIETWLNGLGLGTFEVDYMPGMNGAYFNVLTNSNANNPVSMTLTPPAGAVTVPFQKTNKSLIAFLQAFIDYVCQMTALQIALGNNLSICSFDYNGDVVTQNLVATNKQDDFNSAAASAICNIVSRVDTLTGLTCSKLQGIFSDNSSVAFNNSSDRYLSIVGGSCISLTGRQQALGFINAVNLFSDVKTAFCAINCAVPGSCGVVSGVNVTALSQTSLGFYGVSWVVNPTGNQTITLLYRPTGTTMWFTASTSISLFPNGNINGTTPFVIPGLTAGTTYDISVGNNCGGTPFVTTATTPITPVITASYLLNNVIGSVCSSSPVTLYSSVAFGSTVTMYSDIGLTTPITGFSYIAPASGGQIYNINSGTGVVGSPTGSNCNSGTPNSYILGNNTGTICSAGATTLYTNGAFALGAILYTDSSLINAQTGFSFVVFNNVIYNVNNATGQVTSSTGLTCASSSTLTFDYSAGTWSGSLSSPLLFNLSLTVATVTGYTNGTCTILSGESDSISSPIVINAGNTSATQNNGGLTAASSNYRITNHLTVNGNVLANGGSVIISGVTINLVILHTACSPYTP